MEGIEDGLAPSQNLEDFISAVAMATDARNQRERSQRSQRRIMALWCVSLGFGVATGVFLMFGSGLICAMCPIC